ncbi:putative WD-repeat protein [Rhodotorula toruloides ATCC 204091]|uniref:Putative WD-repeat protein n=1 Tax=Rhodotorula toruloides TaxID=5286 RepID=A0A0K3CKL5_RHOTO|nr:putative WD-repeat protein [Rhodotorula toruloides ATCC 204091]PRQ74736.1 putative WD-repeat protein [Rhodotorula toruloides]
MSRPTKRARVQQQPASAATPAKPKREPLFAPFRSLGHVSTGVPFVLQSRASKHLQQPALTVITSLGASWAMWEGQSMRLLFVGPDMGKPITSMAVLNESVFAAAGNMVGRFVRGKEVGRFVTGGGRTNGAYDSDSDSSDSDSSSSASSSSSSSASSSSDSDSDDEDDPLSPIPESLDNLVLFGNTLIALSSTGRRMYVWDVPPYIKPASKDPLAKEGEEEGDVAGSETDEEQDERVVTPYATLEFPTGFTATKVLHPASYLNKVVVGSKEGEVAVWNVRTGSCIHTFPSSALAGSHPASAVTSLSQSPAIDVLGIGLATGACILFDVRLGEVLGKVRLEGEGAGEVAALSFRTDSEAQTLAVASTSGHVALFDLGNEMKLLHLVRNAHEGPVGGLEWVPGQPLMITSGGDNSVKQWLLDTPTAAPRLLKQRSGHHAPPHFVRYNADDGKSLLTAGADRSLRYTSVVRDSRGYELSQGSIARKATRLDVRPSSLKLPLITSLAYSTARARDWDDVVSVSADESLGRSWSVENKRVGKWTFATEGKATVSAVTACGNFGLVGSQAGDVQMFNMQSGMKRKVFKVPNAGVTDVRGRHVTGLAIDALNRCVVVSTLKGALHFFDFQTMKLMSILTLKASVTSILLQRDNGLLAAVCDDLIVRIVDIETRRVVRELSGPRGRILDIAFSPDSRWIITTSQDSVIRTFDIPTGQLVDAFRTKTVATSLTFSPTGDFLASTHVDSVGIYLWANRAQFSDVSLLSFVEEETLEDVALPTVQGVDADASLSAISAPSRWEDIQPYTTPDQLADSLLTLSLMPRSRWQTLLNLDTIKARNKPKEAPKAPERAPFFLPTLPGVDHRFDFGTSAPNGAAKEKKDDAAQKRKLDFAVGAAVETDFVRRLTSEKKDGNYQSFFEYLKALSPSNVDLEIRSLSTIPHLEAFLHALLARLRSHRDFEACQTFLAVFLRIHGDILIANPDTKGPLEAIAEQQKKEAERLIDLTHYNLGTLAFLRGVALT